MYRKRGFDKRGELTSTQIIGLILAIAGFVIVLILLFSLEFEGQATDEACRLSVLSRATAPESVNEYIPLKCQTKKICFTTGGDCEDFAGEKGVKKYDLSGKLERDKELIERVSAEEMFNCWSMMGEGKLNLFSGGVAKQFGVEASQLSCVICSRFAYSFDEGEGEYRKSLLEDSENGVNVAEYLKLNKVPNRDETYLNYFTDDQVKGYPKVEDGKELDKLSLNDKMFGDSNQMATVFTQIKPKTYENVIGNLVFAGIAVAGTTLASPARALVNPLTVGIVGVGAAGLGVYSMSNVYAGRTVAATYCGNISGGNDRGDGCSGIQIVPYDYKTINQICGVIEGNP